MNPNSALEERLAAVERQLRGTRRFAALATVLLVMGVAGSRPPGTGENGEVEDEIVTRRLVVVDAQGTQRVVIGSEGDETKRIAAFGGITIHDAKGSERGGLGVLSNGTAVMALDAPPGVGASMRDRIGLAVGSDGSATVRMIDNKTSVPVRLVTDPEGGGGLEFLEYDLKQREVTIQRLSAEGETSRVQSLGG